MMMFKVHGKIRKLMLARGFIDKMGKSRNMAVDIFSLTHMRMS